jgi:hypothetical protein
MFIATKLKKVKGRGEEGGREIKITEMQTWIVYQPLPSIKLELLKLADLKTLLLCPLCAE